MGFAESAVITQSVTAQISDMPMTPGITSLQFNEGERFYRVITADTNRTIYCSAGTRFQVHRTMVGSVANFSMCYKLLFDMVN